MKQGLPIRLARRQRLGSLLLAMSAACATSDGAALDTMNNELRVPALSTAVSWSSPSAAGIRSAGPSITRWSIATGGGHASHGGVVLHATLGQPQPGSAAGGSISLQSGFWFASSSPPPAAGRIFGNGFE